MAEKRLNTRIIHKHETEANWLLATNFIPMQGEIIIYDIDSTHAYERVKVGDGKTLVSALPFIDANKVDKVAGKGLSTNDYTTTEKNKLAGIAEGANKTVVDSELSSTSTNPVQNKAVYAKLDTLIGGTPVSEQINTAIANKVDKVSGKGLSTNDYTTTEKNKLSGIESGAEVNQNAFSNITIGSTTIAADTKTDTLTLVAGSNVTITPDAANDKITIAATDTVYTHPSYTSKTSGLYKITVDGSGHVSGATAVSKSDITGLGIPEQDTTYSVATTTTAGLMSAADKITLDSLDSYVGDKKVSDAIDEVFDNAITSLSVSGKVITYTKGDGSTGTVTTQDTNTTYSAGTGISLSGTTFSNSGVRSVTTGSTNGTISVNTNGTPADIAVKGLGSAAYTASTAYDSAGAANTALASAKSYTDAEITEWVGDKKVSEQISTAMVSKADSVHNHDNAYDKKGSADTALASAKTYADSAATKVKNDLLNGAGTAYDTLKELGDLISGNQDAIDALETVAANKANVSDLTAHTGNKSNPHGVTAAQISAVPTSRTVNGKALSSNITLSASDVGADVSGAANTALVNAKAYTDAEIAEWVGDTKVSEQITTAIANKSDTGHTHDDRYYTESEINTKLSGKSDTTHKHDDVYAAKSHGNHVPAAETANNAKFLRNDNTWQTVTPANIGAAASSHGTHVSYSTATPVMDGAASVGSASTVARSDHKHPTDTSRAAASDLTALQTLVGDKKVSEQIQAAQIVYVGPTKPTDPNIKVWINTSEEGTGVVPVLPRVATISLPANAWTGSSEPYSQVVNIATVTTSSKIDLQPSAQQIVDLQNAETSLMIGNDGGVVTCYAIGNKPTVSYTMQVLIQEVAYV